MATISAALRIGMALGGADIGWDEVLDALTTALPEVDAAQVEGWEPLRCGARVLARIGYRQPISEELANRLPFTRWAGSCSTARVRC
jgi:hypothetical protein